MTIGWGERTLAGAWIDTRQKTWVVNVLAFGWHYQICIRLSVDRWDRR